jgi:hypothetical protein
MALVIAAFNPVMAQYAPGGSYMQSCRNIHNHGNSISAQCATTNGQYVHSRIPLPCYGDIANNNGYLVCQRGGGGGGYRPPHGGGGRPGYGFLPPGTYQSTCRNAYANGTMITAECAASNGAMMRTSLNYNRCRGGTDIANINGQLQCLYYR